MYTVSFVYFLLFTWPCDWRYYAYYLIFIEFTSRFAGEVYPHARIEQRKYIKSPEGLTEIGKVLRALFSPRKVYSKGLHKATEKNKKGCEYMTNAKQTNCAKYARGPPKWIRTDSLSWIKTEKVNQIWFTCSNRPNLPRVGRMLLTAQRMRWTPQNRRLARLWGCGAAWAVQLNTRE